MNEGINAAMGRAARISDSTHQGHVLEEPESKFEASIQDIIGLLIDAEGLLEGVSEPTAWQRSDLRQAIGLLSDVRRKLVALAKEERK